MPITFRYSNCVIIMNYLTKVSGSKNYYYKRRIPNDVLAFYPDVKGGQVVRSTKTANKQKAATVAARITRELEAEWDAHRGIRPSTSTTVMEGARRLLEQAGLPPTKTPLSHEIEKDLWIDSIDQELPYAAKEALFTAHIAADTQAQQELLNTYLSDEQRAALDIASGKLRMPATVMRDEYLRLKNKLQDRKELNSILPSFAALVELLGDRHPSEYSTYEVQMLVNHMQYERGWSTGTVKKRLGCLRKTFNYVAKVHDDREAAQHPFASFHTFINGLGEDVIEKADFTPDQLNTLRKAVIGKTDEVSGLIAILMDTGMRPSEACSLSAEDVHGLDNSHPFLSLQNNTFRRLKTKNSVRFMPLVGEGLEYVRATNSHWLFPSYVDEASKTIKNENASTAVNKRLRSILGDGCPTSYSFRHTLTTRLRDVECPQTIQDELEGWASTIRSGYGSPTDIKLKTKYIQNSIDWQGVGWRLPRN